MRHDSRTATDGFGLPCCPQIIDWEPMVWAEISLMVPLASGEEQHKVYNEKWLLHPMCVSQLQLWPH